MTTEITPDSDNYDEIYALTKELAKSYTSIWQGRDISWEDAMLCKQDVEQCILSLFETSESADLNCDRMAAQMIWAGTLPENRPFLGREIQHLVTGKDEVFVMQAGFGKSTSKFWRKHKKEILITAAVIAVVVTVVTIVVVTGGTGAGPAAASGGALLQNLTEDDDKPKKARPPSGSNPIAIAPDAPITKIEPEPIADSPTDPIIYQPFFDQLCENLARKLTEQELASVNRFEEPTFNPNWARDLFKTEPNTYEPPILEAPDPRLHRPQATEMVHPNKAPPFRPQTTELIGNPNQSKVHFHCGINNSYETTEQGGICLYDSLDKKLAVQPHWIHQDNIVHGLTMVALEKVCSEQPQSPMGLCCDPMSDIPEVNIISLIGYASQRLGHAALNHSNVQKSIDYEKETVSKIAEEIIAKNNPKLKQVHVVFSNAGHVMKETLEQIPQEYRDTMIVITTGSTAIIDENLACKVYNIIGSKDWPSKICNGGENGILEAQKDAYIDIVPQTETESMVGGHYFLQPDYQGKLAEIIKKDISTNYEIY